MIAAMAMAFLMGMPQDEPKAQIAGDKMAALFGPDNYPPAAILAGEQGRVIADLAIDAQGRITDCRIIESASTILAEQTCRLAVGQPDLFAPARDRRGKAVPSHYALKIRWQLPVGAESALTADIPISLRLVSDPDGKAQKCEVRPPSQEGPLVEGGPMCDGLARRLVDAITRKTGKPPSRRFEGRFLIDYAPNAASHNVIAWPKDVVLLNDMNVAYFVTADGKPHDCKRDIRVWDDGAPVPSPCDGQVPNAPPPTAAASSSPLDALLRAGYRFLPEAE